MFTGLSPERLSTDWRSPLDDTAPTLAEYLSQQGYETAGFVANMGYCGWESGLDRGFGHYEDEPVSVRQLLLSSAVARFVISHPRVRELMRSDENFVRKTADDVNAGFLRWLSKRDDKRPFFAFLNYYDAHAPYMPPEPFRSRYIGAVERGGLSPLHRWNSDPSTDPPPDSVIALEQAAYESTIAYLDDRIGALLSELQHRDLLSGTVVVITSDHGEEFGEHGLYDHGNTLYMPALRVPLLVYYPAGLSGGVRIGAPVSLSGLAGMIAKIADLQNAPFPDRRLADVLSGAALHSSPVLSEVTYARGLPDWFPVSRGNMVSLFDGRWHYIRNGDGREELYDLAHDPMGQRDVAGAGEVRSELARLRPYLTGWTAARLAKGGRRPSTDTMQPVPSQEENR